jgi:hypothetical protein
MLKEENFCYSISKYPTFFRVPFPSERREFHANYDRLKSQFCQWLRKEKNNYREEWNNMIFDYDFGLTVGEMSVLMNHNIVEFNRKNQHVQVKNHRQYHVKRRRKKNV